MERRDHNMSLTFKEADTRKFQTTLLFSLMAPHDLPVAPYVLYSLGY